jgi:two-component system response regulator AtoC
LLSSCDQSLVNAVGGAVRSVEDLRLGVCPRLEDVWAHIPHDRVALLLLHLTAAAAVPEAAALLHKVKSLRRDLPVLVLGDGDDAAQELTLLRLGASDFLHRPLDLGRLSYLVEHHTVEARLALAAERAARQASGVEAVGGDPFLYAGGTSMGRLMQQVRRVARQSTTVLLGGETGTGKTRLARLIHELSPRQGEPFLTVNCGALSETLIESEMFGHVRGAFTGADRDRAGKFAEAGGGTLLLDDIDALPLSLQAKLLRVVDERVFEAVGSNQPQPLRARLVAASNRPLEGEVAGGRFRSDLFYRLNVVGFFLPPLRERRPIIRHVARKFITDLGAAAAHPIRDITPAALHALEAHDWPGNVRELRNVVERAVALCPTDTIDVDDLPDPIRSLAPAVPAAEADGSALPLTRSKEEAEILCITEALQRHSNNRLRAAAALGISRMTLYKKLHKYGLMGLA